MKINDSFYSFLSRFGAIVVLVLAISNVYFVMRHFELYRRAVKAENTAQTMLNRRQQLEGLLREFISRANSDQQLAQILLKYQLVQVGQPAAAPAR